MIYVLGQGFCNNGLMPTFHLTHTIDWCHLRRVTNITATCIAKAEHEKGQLIETKKGVKNFFGTDAGCLDAHYLA